MDHCEDKPRASARLSKLATDNAFHGSRNLIKLVPSAELNIQAMFSLIKPSVYTQGYADSLLGLTCWKTCHRNVLL